MKLINGPADLSGSIFPCGGEGRGSNPRQAYQDFLDLPGFSLLNRFSLRASLKNSVTVEYPFSGCFLMKSSTSLYSSSGMLRVRYFDMFPLCVKHNINNVCYWYVKYNITFISPQYVICNIWLQEGVAA